MTDSWVIVVERLDADAHTVARSRRWVLPRPGETEEQAIVRTAEEARADVERIVREGAPE